MNPSAPARRLLFRGYHAGLGNGRLALDIGVALAHLSGRTLCPFGLQPPWRGSPPQRRGARPIRSPLDLYDVPVPLDPWHALDPDPQTPDAQRWPFGPIYEGALVPPALAAPQRAADSTIARARARDWLWLPDISAMTNGAWPKPTPRPAMVKE